MPIMCIGKPGAVDELFGSGHIDYDLVSQLVTSLINCQPLIHYYSQFTSTHSMLPDFPLFLLQIFRRFLVFFSLIQNFRR